MPAERPPAAKEIYDIYPCHDIGEGKIFRGIDDIAGRIARESLVLIDGYIGVFFETIKQQLEQALHSLTARTVIWVSTDLFLKPESEIDSLVSPFLGGDDPLFGRRTTLYLREFFNLENVTGFLAGTCEPLTIVYGIGAALFSPVGLLLYFDLPKNELQFRARAGSVTNLGAGVSADPKAMYKRFYFVDWIVLNRHKADIAERIDILADAQRHDDITWMTGTDFRESVAGLSANVFRARPWFEPGSWGGSWIKNKIPGINREVPNYAWSFELISPENGIIVTSSDYLLEFSFDFLMYLQAESILGECHDRFKTDFPIRFDFLDTFDGGNLSVQCHPRPEYIKEHFGEEFTQEEAYYILDNKENSGVYLGFRDDISEDAFRETLAESLSGGTEVKIDEYLLFHPSRKHDFFLIPCGTVHGSGINNLVLEISTTPYIFTFKMYDWLRPDLDGRPRPLNLGRAMENLYFSRKGKAVYDELISRPQLEQSGPDWKIYHLPTHHSQLYDVKRCHFNTVAEFNTFNRFFVMSLVEGVSISVRAGEGEIRRYSYAETFIIPAAAKRFRLINEGAGEAIVVMAFVK